MKAKAAKAAFGLLWLAIFVEIVADTHAREVLFGFLTAHPLLAPLVLIVLQCVLAALLLPCSPLTVLAGVLWGVWAGLAYSTLSTVCASLLTFFLGRRVLRGWLLERMPSGWRRQLMVTIERFGWKASAVAHANPVFPGSSLGYAFGASNIGLGTFATGALVGNLPLQVLMVKAGDIVRDIAEAGLSAGIAIVAVLVAICFGIYRLAAPMLLSTKESGGGRPGP